MFEKINNVVFRQANKHGFRNQAAAARICFEAKRLYSDLFEPISFKNSVLTVGVENSFQAQEVQFKQKEIIEKINNKIGSQVIKRLRSRVQNFN